MKKTHFRPLFLYTILSTIVVLSGCSSSTSPSSGGGNGTGGGGLKLSTTDTVNFGAIPVGQTKDTSILIVNTGTNSLTITSNALSSSEARDTNFSHSIGLASGGFENIHIQFTPSAPGAQTAYDSIHYQSGGANYVAVMTLEANMGTGGGTGAGSLIAIPPSINFDSIPIGQWHDTTVTLFNSGSIPITITSEGMSSAEGHDTNFHQTVHIAPQNDLIIHVQFNPSQAGLRMAVDSIHYTSGGTSSVVLVTLTATGVTVSTSPGAGSTFTYAVDTNGVSQGDSTYTILSNMLSFQGKTNVIEVLGPTGDTNYYHIESNGDISIYFDFSALASFVSIPSSWLAIPIGSRQATSTTLVNNPNGSIQYNGLTVPGSITVTAVGAYIGPEQVTATGKTFATENGSMTINFNFQGTFQNIPVSYSQSNSFEMWYSKAITFYPKRQDVATSTSAILGSSLTTTNYLLLSDKIK